MPPIDSLTSTQRMADAVLKGHDTDGLYEYLSELHTAGLSLEAIARELHVKTDGVVSISFKTVSRWLENLDLIEAVS